MRIVPDLGDVLSRGFFGIGVFHSKSVQNIGTLWRSAHCFGAAFIFTVGRRYEQQASDTMKTQRHIPLYHYKDIGEMKTNTPFGTRIVGVELTERSKPLSTFTHPETAIYLLGAEDHGLNPEAIAACHSLVQIEGASRCLNVAVAGSIVIYDRISKS